MAPTEGGVAKPKRRWAAAAVPPSTCQEYWPLGGEEIEATQIIASLMLVPNIREITLFI